MGAQGGYQPKTAGSGGRGDDEAVAAVARLLADGTDPNMPDCADPSIQTPLCAAARFGRLEAARLLLEGGAHPDVPDSDGITPLTYAVVHIGAPQTGGPRGFLTPLGIFLLPSIAISW
jgi:ankyrin repeat protein